MAIGDYPKAEDYFNQSLDITRQIGDQEGDISSLSGLAELALHQDDLETAQDYNSQALKISQQIGTLNYEGFIQLVGGDIFLRLGMDNEAAQAYKRSVEIRQEINQPGLLLASRAGLARLAIKSGDFQTAQTIAADLLEALQSVVEVSNDELILIYLTCYQSLVTHQAHLAAVALQTALRLIESSAAKIRDEQMRNSFMTNVPVNRQLLAYRDQSKRGLQNG